MTTRSKFPPEKKTAAVICGCCAKLENNARRYLESRAKLNRWMKIQTIANLSILTMHRTQCQLCEAYIVHCVWSCGFLITRRNAGACSLIGIANFQFGFLSALFVSKECQETNEHRDNAGRRERANGLNELPLMFICIVYYYYTTECVWLNFWHAVSL